MNNIRVYINDTEVGYYQIEDTGVTFTWQAKLINEINSFSTTTTKTITLPLTKGLKTLLKSPDVIDTTNSVSNRAYFRIDITWNDTVAVKGYIKLQKVVILENDEYIEFSVEPREKDWITQFKNFKLTEVDFTLDVDQTHALTYANIVTSETFLAAREYVYAPIDISEIGRLQVLWVIQAAGFTYFFYVGKQIVTAGNTFVCNTYGFEESNLTQYNLTLTDDLNVFWNSRGVYVGKTTTIPLLKTTGQTGFLWCEAITYWQVSDFYPLVRQQAIVKRCFNRIGYGVTIVDNSDYFNNKYNYLHNIEQLNKLEANRVDNNYFKVKVNLPLCTTAFVPAGVNPLIMPFMNVTQYGLKTNVKYTDTNSNVQANIDAGTNISRFTATEACVMKCKVNYEFETGSSGAYSMAMYIQIRQYDSSNTERRQDTIREILTSDTSNEYASGNCESSYFYMASGDYLVCVLLASWSGGTVSVFIKDSCTMESFMYEGGNFKNKSIRLNEYLPDVPAYDYIKDLSFINNWEFYTNEKLKQVYIVREDYKRTGKQIDFKQKINKNYPVELEEIGSQWAKKSYFNWKKDEKDWCIKFIEQVTKASLGTTYKPEELEMAARFGMGLITNLNLFTIQIQEFINNIYAASLDKFDTSNRINFNTVEMKGEETYEHLPTWKRIDYEPRYLTVYFGQTLETNGVNGVTSVVYSIEGNTNHTTYPRVEFGEPLHYGDATGLLVTKYAKKTRAIKYGWIFRAKFTLTENDVETFVETYEDNNFRGDYELQLKGVKKIGELLKVNDFSPLTSEQTEIEFVIYRDDL
jgi:hypothetical protein